MAEAPMLELYVEAICVSERSELAAITGKRVAVVARFQDPAGDWNYRVYDPKEPSVGSFICRERELLPHAPDSMSDDRSLMADVIDQTAQLRHSGRCDGLRRLLRERGYNPAKCIQISLDQGRDVHVILMLPDGTVVGADFQIDPETRQATQFATWKTEDYCDREIELCRQVLSCEDASEFDVAVERRFTETNGEHRQ